MALIKLEVTPINFKPYLSAEAVSVHMLFNVEVEGRGDCKRSLLAERPARTLCWASYDGPPRVYLHGLVLIRAVV